MKVLHPKPHTRYKTPNFILIKKQNITVMINPETKNSDETETIINDKTLEKDNIEILGFENLINDIF